MFKNLLKKSFALLAVCVVSLGTETAASETSEWSLYLWSNTTSSGSEAGSFESTPDENVFILKNCNLTESGITYCIHDAAWSKMYGWSADRDGVVSAIGETVPVGETTQASGWCSLPPFNYDVVFDLGAKTVLFTPHAEDGDKRVSILGDSYSTMVGWMTPSSNNLLLLGGNSYMA